MSIIATRRAGFTIVELLVVIVVIAILATISVVAYSGVQQRARDAQRKSDLAIIVKVLQMYESDNGPMSTGSGCGSGGNGSGFFNYTYYSPGSDMNECLKAGGYLSVTIKDPLNTVGCSISSLNCRKYMKYTCLQSGVLNTYVYANLETKEHTASDTDGTCYASADTDYGMNYYVKV